MSIKVNHYINNTIAKPPKNWQEHTYELNFDKDGNATPLIDTKNFSFVRENAELFYAKLRNDELFDAVPFKIEIERGANTEIPFNGYLDVSASENVFSKEESTIKIIEEKSIDWLNSVADGFTFEFLVNQGIITNNDYQFIPYVINAIPDYYGAAVALLGAYMVTTQLKDAIAKIQEAVTALGSSIDTAARVLSLIFSIIYLSSLLIALVKFVKDFINMTIQPVKYHACMSVKTQLEKACQYLDLSFSSSIFDSIFEKAYIMPEKYNNPPDTVFQNIFGFTVGNRNEQKGEYKGTFGDLLRGIKECFNAKVVIQNGTLYFERIDYNITPPLYILPDIYNIEERPNTDEFRANYYLHFDIDSIEKNTIQEYLGTAYQVILKPASTPNNIVNMKGLEDVFIPFTLAKRKTELTLVEKIIKGFLNVIDVLINTLINVVNSAISVINGVIGFINDVIDVLDVIGINISFNLPSIPSIPTVNLSNLIENRIGMLKLDSDFTSRPKIFLMDLGSTDRFNKIPVENDEYFSAEWLYNNYHYINSYLPTQANPTGNQYIYKTYDDVPFGFDDFLQVKENNQITVLGKEAKVLSLKWNPYHQTAYISVKIKELLTSNFSQTILIPNGR